MGVNYCAKLNFYAKERRFCEKVRIKSWDFRGIAVCDKNLLCLHRL